MVQFRSKGDFHKLNTYLEQAKSKLHISELDKYGRMGVDALASATPKDSGETSNSWYYDIERNNNSVTIGFYNKNIQNGIPIAIILQYGHATKNGGWVQGRDYINPAIQPIFDKIAKDAWKEVTEI